MAQDVAPHAFHDISYGADPSQKLDVYAPVDAHNAPIIFMVHGGGWRRGDKEMGRVVDNKSVHFLAKGYVFVSANYRMEDRVSPLDQAQDLAKAVALVEARAGEWGGDPSRVILMGHSAGAHLVGLLSVKPPAWKYPALGSVLLDSAALDLVRLMEQHHMRLYDNVFGRDKAVWRANSPYDQLTQATAPMLLVCSSKRLESCPQAQVFAKKANGLGSKAYVLPEDMTHGEINYNIGKPSDYTQKIDQFIEGMIR